MGKLFKNMIIKSAISERCRRGTGTREVIGTIIKTLNLKYCTECML